MLTLQRTFHLSIPRKGITRPQSQFLLYSHVSVSHLYIPKICSHIWLRLQQNRQTDPGNI
jgi:hypothetical protein